MSAHVCESGPATNPNAVSPPAPAWGYCPNCGGTQEDASQVEAPPELGPGTLYLCYCHRWYTNDDAHPVET
jgi:hypothetical protein